ncbi:hypothetical protein L195_g054706, partial [Trifolium pratense]
GTKLKMSSAYHPETDGQTEVLNRRHPPNLLRFLSNETKVAAVAVELSERDEALNHLKVHLSRAQEQMKHQADKKCRQVTFEVVGDYQVQGDLPKELEVTDAEDVYPDQVLGSRVDMRGGVSVPQSLIKWKNRSI